MVKKLWFFTKYANPITNDLKDAIVVPTDWASAKQLDSMGIRYVLPENYVKRDVYVRLDKAAETIATNWWRNEYLTDLHYKGLRLGYLLEWEFHITLAKFLKQLVDLNTIVMHEKPDIIIGSLGNNMFTQIQQFIAAKYGIVYQPITSTEPAKSFHMDVIPVTFKIGSKLITIHLTQSQFKQATEMINKLTRLLRIFGGKSGSRKLLMLDFNIVQYSAMLEGFEKHGMEVFLLNKRRPTVWNLDSLKKEMKKKFKFASLTEYADSNSRTNVMSASRQLNETIECIWEKSNFDNEFCFDGLSFWEVIRDDFKDFCKSRMSQGIEDLEYGSNFFDRNKFDMAVVWGYVLPFEKVMLQLAKERGIPSLAIQHGVLTNLRDKNGDWTFLESRHSDADIIAAWGMRGREWFVKNGIPEERVVDMGSPRYDAIFALRDVAKQNTNNIILATSGLPTSFSSYNTVSTAKRYEEFIREICLAITKFPEKKLIVKLHPFADEIIDVISVVHNVDPNIRIAKNENIVDLILDSDLLISTYSSVVLESMIIGKPTMVFDALADMFEPVHLPYAESGASLKIQEPDNVRSTLEMFFSDQSLRGKLEKNSRRFVSEHLSNPANSINVLSNYIANKVAN
jgi:hypothetical protein